MNLRLHLKIKSGNIFKNLALIGLFVYIVVSGIFETDKSSLSSLASYSIYFCLALGVLYLGIQRRFTITPTMIIIFTWFILIFISSLYSPAADSTINMYISRLLKTLPIVLIICNVVDNEKDFQLVLYAYIFAGVGLAIHLYLSYGIQNLIELADRIDSELGNQNIIGIRCAYTIIFSVYEIVFGKLKRYQSFVTLLLIAVTVPAVLFSGSRKALLTIIVSIFIIFLLNSYNIKKTIASIIIASILMFSFWYLINKVAAFGFMSERINDLINVFSGKGEVTESDATRVFYITDGLKHFVNSPIWGNGFIASYAYYGTYTHNNYVELLLDMGVCGFLYYYAIFLGMFNKAIKNVFCNKKLKAFIIMFCLMFFTIDIGVVTFYDRSVFILLSVVLTMVDKTVQKEKL